MTANERYWFTKGCANIGEVRITAGNKHFKEVVCTLLGCLGDVSRKEEMFFFF